MRKYFLCFRCFRATLDDGTTCDTGKVSWTAKRRT